ncbi:MAG: alpha/beta hydrolase family protein [Burkholderiales bacterium]|nr:alpha/beta hydrolase family protein [Burkholderiales bacterium]
MRTLLLLLSLLFSPAVIAQADYAREQRWADEITPTILVGDPVQLALPSGRKFLGIHTPNPKAQTGVILVHGLGVHPDWGLINPLRSQLSDQGYTTLSIQMPVLAADAPGSAYPPLFQEAAERIAAAVQYLRNNGLHKIVIVSHSLGARMTNVFLNTPGRPAIDAWVSIGITSEYTRPETFDMPVLDLYGEKDFPGVLGLAQKRASSITGIRGSAQIQVAGADHYFNGSTTELVRAVKLFLDSATR